MKSLAEKLKNCYRQQVSYIYCLAYCTKLVVKDTISSSELLQLAMCTLKKLYTFLGVYPKRVKLFEEMQKVNPFVDGNEDINSLSHKTTCIKKFIPNSMDCSHRCCEGSYRQATAAD